MGARHTTGTATEITYALSLVIDAKGHARITRDPPALSPGEREMRLSVTVPKAIFRTPSLSAKITVKNDEVYTQKIAAVEEKASKALREVLGAECTIMINEPSAKK